MLLIEKGKIVKSVGIKLPGGKVTKSQQEGESYVSWNFRGRQIFKTGDKPERFYEVFHTVKKVLSSKLNGGNLVPF